MVADKPSSLADLKALFGLHKSIPACVGLTKIHTIHPRNLSALTIKEIGQEIVFEEV